MLSGRSPQLATQPPWRMNIVIARSFRAHIRHYDPGAHRPGAGCCAAAAVSLHCAPPNTRSSSRPNFPIVAMLQEVGWQPELFRLNIFRKTNAPSAGAGRFARAKLYRKASSPTAAAKARTGLIPESGFDLCVVAIVFSSLRYSRRLHRPGFQLAEPFSLVCWNDKKTSPQQFPLGKDKEGSWYEAWAIDCLSRLYLLIYASPS